MLRPGIEYKNVWLFALGLIALSVASVENAHAVTLTVSTSTDTPNLYPGGQTAFSGATTGDLRYCINYILNEQAQGVTQDYDIVFAPGIESIQLGAKLSMVNLLGSSTIVIGNPDPAQPVTITGSAGTGGLFVRQGSRHLAKPQLPELQRHRRQRRRWRRRRDGCRGRPVYRHGRRDAPQCQLQRLLSHSWTWRGHIRLRRRRRRAWWQRRRCTRRWWRLRWQWG